MGCISAAVGLLWTQYDYRHTIISPEYIAAVDRQKFGDRRLR